MMIETKGLRKSFRSRAGRENKTVEAVRGVDLDVAEGEIFGFLGPNGAGKTTTLRMLATLHRARRRRRHHRRRRPAQASRARCAGASATWPRAAAPGTRSTAREELVLQARLYGMSKADAAARAAAEALEAFQLTEYADRKCKTYSGGQRRRVDIALGIIHEPKVVFLDEPTTGLDPQSRAHMWDEVRRLRARGHDRLPHHALPGRGRRALRPHRDHGPRPDRRRGHARRAQARDLRRRGHRRACRRRPPRPARAKLLDGPSRTCTKLETADDGGLRLYVDDGATAIPQVLRALDAAGMQLRLDRAAPAQPRRRVPGQDRPLAAGKLRRHAMKFAP